MVDCHYVFISDKEHPMSTFRIFFVGSFSDI